MAKANEKEIQLGFKPQKELSYLKCLPYHDKLDIESQQLLQAVKTHLGRAVMLRELTPGVTYWTFQLGKYIHLYGRKFSKEDHLTFINLIFDLVIIPELELDIVQQLAHLLTLLLKKRELLPREDLQLPWWPLYKLYERILYSPYEHMEMLLLPGTMESALKSLVRACRVYFSVESTQEMLDEWRPLLCPFDITMSKAMAYFDLFLPTMLPPEHHAQGFKLWFQEFMAIWNACHNAPAWECNLVWLFSRLACETIGYIDWDPYMPVIFTRLLRSFNLPGGSSKFHIVRSNNTFETSAVVAWIVAMLGGNGSCQQHINRLFKTLESYYHPSNNGKWMIRLQRFLYKLPAMLIKRLHKERFKLNRWETPVPESHRLTDEGITQFVQSMTHVVFLAIFSKVGCADSAFALKNLSLVRPEQIIPPLLERFYSALETLTEPHRLTATMHCMVSVSRALVRGGSHFPEGPSHVIPLLVSALPGIDPNDIKKCMVTFQFISTFTTLVPLVDCSQAVHYRNDLTEIEHELCLATAGFEDFVLQFMDRCFVLIENSSLENTSRLDRDTERMNVEENILEIGLSSTFVSILTQSSPEIFRSALSKLHAFVSNRILETRVSGKLAANLCRSASKVNAKLSLQTFLPHFSKLVLTLTESEEVMEEQRLDDELLFGLLLLSEVVRCDGCQLLAYRELLEKVLKRTLHLKSRKGYMLSGALLRHTLKAITLLYPLDFRSTSHALKWDSAETFRDYLPIRDWGKSGDMNKLGIDWHIPNSEELDMTVDFLESFLRTELISLQDWSADKTSLTREDIQRSLSIILDCLLGAGGVLPLWSEDNIDIIESCTPLHYLRVRETGIQQINFKDGVNIRKYTADILATVLDRILTTCEDDTKSLFLIIRIYHAVMFYWGVGREDFDKRWKGFHVVKKALEDKSSGRKQHIRALLLDRILLQHESRMLDRSKCPFTSLHKSMIDNLLKLSVSHYSDVRAQAQDTLQLCFPLLPYSYHVFLPSIINALKKDPVANHEEFKGTLYILLGHKHNTLLTVNDWQVIRQIWPALVSTQPSEKPSIIRLLDKISESIQKYMETNQIHLEISESCLNKAKMFWNVEQKPNPFLPAPTAGEILVGLQKEAELNATNLKNYFLLVDELLELLRKGSLHWRHYHLATVMLSLLVRHDVSFPPKAVQFFVSHLTNDTLNIRKLSVSVVAAILKQQKRPHPKVELKGNVYDLVPYKSLARQGDSEMPSNLWLQYNNRMPPTDQETWNKYHFVHKTHIGFYSWPKPFLVYAGDEQQPNLERAKNELLAEEAIIYDTFMDQNFISSLISYLSLEERKGHDKFDAKRFYLFKGLFRNFGDTFLPIFLVHLKRLVEDNHESSQRCAAEIISGLLRGSKHWPYHKMDNLKDAVTSLLTIAFDHITPETVADWGTCIATASESRDPNKYYWLFELLLDNPIRGEGGSFLESSRLYLLLGVLAQQEWRVFEPLNRLLTYLGPHMTHAYQNVREKLGSILSNIFQYDVAIFSQGCLSMAPKLSPFVNRVLMKMAILAAIGHFNHHQNSNSDSSAVSSKLETKEKKEAINLFKTICKWLLAYIPRSFNSAPPDIFKFLPLLCLLQSDPSDDEVQADCTYTIAVMGQAFMLPKSIETAISTVAEISLYSNWHSRAAALSFLQLMVFSNMFSLMSNELWVKEITRLVLKLLGDERLEVRERAVEVLGGFLHCEFVKIDGPLLDMFKQKCKKKLRKRKSAGGEAITVEPGDLIERHSGVLGLCACVNAYPYDVPEFLPDILVTLGDHLNDPQPIPATVKKTLSNFRRTHHDNWRDHKLKFTDDQLAVITDLLVSPSYYA